MFLGRKFPSKSHTQFSILRRRLFFLVLWQRLLCSLFFVGQKKTSCSTKKKRFLRRRTKIKLFVGVEKWVATSLLPSSTFLKEDHHQSTTTQKQCGIDWGNSWKRLLNHSFQSSMDEEEVSLPVPNHSKAQYELKLDSFDLRWV